MEITEQKKIDSLEKKQKAMKIIEKILIYLFLVLVAFFVLFPFYWMIITSLKTFEDYIIETVPAFWPTHITIQNFATAVTTINLGSYMLNTVLFSVLTTGLMVLITILASFAFAKFEFKGKNIAFTIFLATMMIPMELFTITNYATIVNLKLTNTFVGLVFPSVMSVFYIYLLRQNFMIVPEQIYFAARVDGLSDFKYLWKVLVPMSKSTIISIVILKFIECWNSYVWPRLVTDDKAMFLISNGIQELRNSGFGRENIPAMMAAVVIVSVPLIIVYLIFRNQIMSGVSRGGVKG